MFGSADIFLLPDPEARASGGNLYNAALLRTLRDAGHAPVPLTLAEAAQTPRLDLALAGGAGGASGLVVVDSWYLPEFAALARRIAGRLPTGLLVHYLPSLVAHGEDITGGDLRDFERTALAAADFFVATSAWMQRTLVRLGASRARIAVVTPAAENPARPPGDAPATLRGLMLAPLTRAKGVAEWLAQLSDRLHGDEAFVLDVVGATDAEPEQHDRINGLLCAGPLDGRVRLHGERPHHEAMELLANADVLVSASHMESFGMAVGEARHAGVPIIARAGGAVRDQIVDSAGGRLCRDTGELVEEFLRLVRDRPEHRRRLRLAQRNAPPPRAWPAVAADYVEATGPWRTRRAGA